MKTRKIVEFTTTPHGCEPVTIKGHATINGLAFSKIIQPFDGGDWKYTKEWALYDVRTGICICLASNKILKLNNGEKATPAQILAAVRRERLGQKIDNALLGKPDYIESSTYILDRLAPLPKVKQTKIEKGMNALNRFMLEVNTAKLEAPKKPNDDDALQTNLFETQKISFKIGRGTYSCIYGKEALEAFQFKMNRSKLIFKDALLNQTDKHTEPVIKIDEFQRHLFTENQAKELQRKIKESELQQERQEAHELAVIEAAAEYETLPSIQQFFTGTNSNFYTPLKMANAKKALNQQTRVDGGPIIKVHEFIENIAKLGAKTRCLQVPKIKPLSRMADFRATNEQQKAHELKMKQSGTKPEYMFGAYLVNKISYEYALFLEAKQAKAAALEVVLGEALEVVLKIEQPVKPLATTCNPEAARLRAKASICRAANRPAWAKILEDKAEALDRVDPPEPPPCKHKRARPRKTACILLAKIRHPVRQNFRERLAEQLVSNIHEPPGIKTDTPPAHFHQPKPRINPCHAHNLNPATHQPPRSKSKQSAAIYPWRQRPNFAASTLQVGKHGKLDDTACPPPFGGYSTSCWITQSCRTKTKKTLPVQTPPVQISHVKNLAFSLLNFSPQRRENRGSWSDVMA